MHYTTRGPTGPAIESNDDGPRHHHATARGPSSLDIPLRGGGHTHAVSGEWLEEERELVEDELGIG